MLYLLPVFPDCHQLRTTEQDSKITAQLPLKCRLRVWFPLITWTPHASRYPLYVSSRDAKPGFPVADAQNAFERVAGADLRHA